MAVERGTSGWALVRLAMVMGVVWSAWPQPAIAADASLGQLIYDKRPAARVCISGEVMIWYADDGYLYVYDIQSGRTKRLVNVGTNPYPTGVQPRQPLGVDMAGDLIVWDDLRDGDFNIFVCQYDRSAGSCATVDRITTDSRPQWAPRVSAEGVIAWIDGRHRDPNAPVVNDEIYACQYNRMTHTCPEHRLTNDPAEVYEPAVSGVQVAWIDKRNPSRTPDIYTCTYDPQTGACPNVRVTEPDGYWGWPRISGTRLVFQGSGIEGGLPGGIYLYDLAQPGSGLQPVAVAPHATLPTAPAIDGQFVVWAEPRDDRRTLDLYALDLVTRTEIQLTADMSLNEAGQDISGGRMAFLVWSMNAWDPKAVYLKGLPWAVDSTTPPPRKGGSYRSN